MVGTDNIFVVRCLRDYEQATHRNDENRGADAEKSSITEDVDKNGGGADRDCICEMREAERNAM